MAHYKCPCMGRVYYEYAATARNTDISEYTVRIHLARLYPRQPLVPTNILDTPAERHAQRFFTKSFYPFTSRVMNPSS